MSMDTQPIICKAGILTAICLIPRTIASLGSIFWLLNRMSSWRMVKDILKLQCPSHHPLFTSPNLHIKHLGRLGFEMLAGAGGAGDIVMYLWLCWCGCLQNKCGYNNPFTKLLTEPCMLCSSREFLSKKLLTGVKYQQNICVPNQRSKATLSQQEDSL